MFLLHKSNHSTNHSYAAPAVDELPMAVRWIDPVASKCLLLNSRLMLGELRKALRASAVNQPQMAPAISVDPPQLPLRRVYGRVNSTHLA